MTVFRRLFTSLPRPKLWLIGLGFLGLLLQPVEAAGVRVKAVRAHRSTIELYDRLELTIQVEGAVQNPYDPEEIAIEATFHPPSGQPISVSGFYYQPFELVTENNQMRPQPAGEPVWKVRFTPTKPGAWSYEVKLITPGQTQVLAGSQDIEVLSSTQRGFVRVDRATESLRFDRGETFIPIGENLCWPPSATPLQTYEQWFRDLVKQRANYLRIWLAPWSFRLETKETGVGRYDQLRAWYVDTLLERSEALGLYWQLVLLDHGSFSRTQDPEWPNNP